MAPILKSYKKIIVTVGKRSYSSSMNNSMKSRPTMVQKLGRIYGNQVSVGKAHLL